MGVVSLFQCVKIVHIKMNGQFIVQNSMIRGHDDVSFCLYPEF